MNMPSKKQKCHQNSKTENSELKKSENAHKNTLKNKA